MTTISRNGNQYFDMMYSLSTTCSIEKTFNGIWWVKIRDINFVHEQHMHNSNRCLFEDVLLGDINFVHEANQYFDMMYSISTTCSIEKTFNGIW